MRAEEETLRLYDCYASDTAAALNVRIPYTVDRKNIQKYKICEKNKNYTIDHITVSDEQKAEQLCDKKYVVNTK